MNEWSLSFLFHISILFLISDICKMTFLKTSKRRKFELADTGSQDKLHSDVFCKIQYIQKKRHLSFKKVLQLFSIISQNSIHSCVTLQPKTMGSFVTSSYFNSEFVIYCLYFHKSNFCGWLQACQEHLYCSSHPSNYKNKKKQHTNKKRNKSPHILYLHSCWMGRSHPPDKSEVYYLQGCHAGTFSKYKNQTMLKNTTLHFIISTLWCHILKMYRMLPICVPTLRKCP